MLYYKHLQSILDARKTRASDVTMRRQIMESQNINNYQYFGLMLYKNKDIYRGYFKDNLKSGQGLLLKFVNGYQEIYEG